MIQRRKRTTNNLVWTPKADAKLKDILEEKERKKQIQRDNAVINKSFKINTLDLFGISGVYMLYNKGKLMYVGESSCVISRISTHFKEGEKVFDTFKYIMIEGSKERKIREKKLIRRKAPLLNMMHNRGNKLLKKGRK